jgi:ABC-type oligopeptide transport system ATPase subunit
MVRGKLVEVAPSARLFGDPQHAYTRMLLSSMPIPDPARERARKLQTLDVDSLLLDGDMVQVAPEHYVRMKRGMA